MWILGIFLLMTLSPIIFFVAFFSPLLIPVFVVGILLAFIINGLMQLTFPLMDRTTLYCKAQNENCVVGYIKALFGDLKKLKLNNLNLTKSNLKNANLHHCNMIDSKLNKSNLEHANLSKSFLTAANLKNANLEDANLYKTWLVKASLENADLSNANLSGANLCGANLEDAKTEETNFYCAIFDQATRLPFSIEEALRKRMIFVHDYGYAHVS